MTKSCFNHIKDIPDEFLNGRNAKEIFEDLKAKINSDASDREEQVNRLRDEILNNNRLDDKQIKNWNNIIGTANIFNEADKVKNKRMAGLLTGVFSRDKGSRLSVAAQQVSGLEVCGAILVKNLKQEKLLDYFKNAMGKQDEVDIVTAMKKMEDAPNESARKVAKIINDVFERNRTLLEKNGYLQSSGALQISRF